MKRSRSEKASTKKAARKATKKPAKKAAGRAPKKATSKAAKVKKPRKKTTKTTVTKTTVSVANPSKRARPKPKRHPALARLAGRPRALAEVVWEHRPWPVFAPAAARVDRRFMYVPWLARYYSLSPRQVVATLRKWQAAGLVELHADEDRARAMATSDRALCPVEPGAAELVWAVLT